MGARARKRGNWSRVLLDICTQRDYLDAGGIVQVANLDTLVPNLKKIFSWARSARLSAVSSVESHRRSEPLKGFPLHCIDDTRGQEKVDYSLIRPFLLIEADNYLSLPPDLRQNYRQLIFRKRGRDVLTNPKADRFLTQLDCDEFIILGVGLERTIRSLALGLLARHKPVTVVSDACGYWSAADADLALRQMSAKTIKLVTTEELTATPVAEPVRARTTRRNVRNRHHPETKPASGRTKSNVTG